MAESRLRIALACTAIAPDRAGGLAIAAEHLAEALMAQGHEVVLLTTSRGNGLLRSELVRYQVAGVPAIAVTTTGPVDNGRDYDDHRIRRRFRQVVTSLDPDVVVFSDLRQFGPGVLRDTVLDGVPAVVLLQDAWWLCELEHMIRTTGQSCGQLGINLDVCATCVLDLPSTRRQQQVAIATLNAAQAIVVSDDHWRDRAIGSGLTPTLVHVVPAGAQAAPQVRPRPRPEGPVRFGFVGSTGLAGGQQDLIDALRSIRRSDYELWVVDPSDLRGPMRQASRFWPVPGYVRVLENTDIADLSGFYSAIDVLVAPSQAAQARNPFLQGATTRGIWVVAPQLRPGEQPGLVDGSNAMLVPTQGFATGLASTLDRILEAPELFTASGHSPGTSTTYQEQATKLAAVLQSAIATAASPA